MKKGKEILKLEQDIIDLIEEAQPTKFQNGTWIENYKPFVRQFAGQVRQVLNSKNPLHFECLIIDIGKIQEIVNPELVEEVLWFSNVKDALIAWRNDRIKAHRILGIKNDNQ